MTIPVAAALSLELLDEHHAEPLLALVDANRAHLRPWLPWVDHMLTAEDFRNFVAVSRKRHAAGVELPLVIRREGRLAGRIGIYHIDTYNKTGAIGYWLGRGDEGRGIVTRACRTLIGHAFDTLGLNRIEIRCGTGNHRSQAVPERLGFTREGVVRQGERLYDGFIDLCLYSVLREEWE